MSKKVALLVVDGQRGFCDDTKGALAVNGGGAAMINAAKMLDRVGGSIDEILCTLDQHHQMHIANNVYWRDSNGSIASPFTQIHHDDIKKGKFRPVMPGKFDWVLEYTEKLEQSGRVLMLWPPHCLIGSEGACLHPALLKSILDWESAYTAYAVMVAKGSNIDTEHYGALEAEVPTADFSTQTNPLILDTLKDYDQIPFVGLATDYCVATTIRQIVKKFGPGSAAKFALLEDCVAGIDKKNSDDFIQEMIREGMTVTTSDNYLR